MMRLVVALFVITEGMKRLSIRKIKTGSISVMNDVKGSERISVLQHQWMVIVRSQKCIMKELKGKADGTIVKEVVDNLFA